MKNIRAVIIIVLIAGACGVLFYLFSHPPVYEFREQGTAEHTEAMKVADVLEATEPVKQELKPSIAVSIIWKNGVKLPTESITETFENISEAYVDGNRQLLLVFKEEMKEDGTYNEHKRRIPLENILFWDFIGKNLREPNVY